MEIAICFVIPETYQVYRINQQENLKKIENGGIHRKIAGMHWYERLEKELEARASNYSKASRACGFRAQRLHEIVKEQSIPNPIDALIVCRYLGVTMEDVFGDDADEELKRSLEADSKRARSKKSAGGKALAEQLGKVARRLPAKKLRAGKDQGIA